MNLFKKWISFLCAMHVFGTAVFLNGQTLDYTRMIWLAQWIAPPNASLLEYGVYHFRRTFDLAEAPARFIVHVTADNRYRLFVNGRPVCFGPSRGDIQHWRYESVDLAPFLHAGKNVIAAVVWNFGEYIPLAQFTIRTGFLLQGDGQAEQIVNTGANWKVFHNEAYSPLSVEWGMVRGYFVSGPGDRVEGGLYPWGWETPDFDDSSWDDPRWLGQGYPRGKSTDGGWHLVPRQIPMMEQKEEFLSVVRRAEGIPINALSFKSNEAFEIPSHSRVSLLLDQTFLTTAYPELAVSDGKGSEITLIYAEALFDSNYQKGHRDTVRNRQIIGCEDRFLPDGGANRLFRPLWFRTYRYIQMNIRTEDAPLKIHTLKSVYTAYPFEERARFESSDSSLSDIWKIAWRTARLCAGETYYDCPYYEQLQYVGDTRIQAMISLYVSGDDRLMRQAIQMWDDSRISEGLTQSRYPCSRMQVIPTYSLFWIAMIHDYWMYRDDPDFVRCFLPGIQSVIRWHADRLDGSGMLGHLTWWNFVDWAAEWPWNNEDGFGGVPARDEKGRSSILSLQFVYALHLAAELADAFDDPGQADAWRNLALKVRRSTGRLCWDEKRALFADTPEKKVFSQHANVLAVLTDAIPQTDQIPLLKRLLADSTLIQCTMYYRFYLYRALIKAGLGERYVDLLDPWHDMLRIGLTTCSERPEPTRSDCHAWSASPNFDFLATVCGIMPDEPGFRSVRIAPHPGSLKWVKGEMPHPAGMIRVGFERTGLSGLSGEVQLPDGLTGRMIWNGREIFLRGGVQNVAFE